MRGQKLLVLLIMLVFVAACSESPIEPPALESDVMFGMANSNLVVGSVTGSGHAPCAPESTTTCLAPGPLRTFTVSARVHADGSVSGTAQVHLRSGEGHKLMIDLECVNFFGENQNRAWFAGPITQSNNPERPVGMNVGFAVADNGEGGEADADQITGIGPGPPWFVNLICDPGLFPPGVADAQLDGFFDNVFGFDISNGSIQVRAPDEG